MKHTQTCLLITQKISSLCDFCISLNFNFCKICAFPFLLNIVKNGKAWQKRETRYHFSCWKWSQMSHFWWLILHHNKFLLAYMVCLTVWQNSHAINNHVLPFFSSISWLSRLCHVRKYYWKLVVNDWLFQIISIKHDLAVVWTWNVFYLWKE